MLEGKVIVQFCIRVTYPNIKEGGSVFAIPKTSGHACLDERLGLRKFLKDRFYLNITAKHIQHLCFKIARLVMTLNNKAATSADHGTICVEGIPAYTYQGLAVI